ncbi:hypothetical protein FOYG_13646 [Fusarium oxysporum NRRL 32931]|uniref:Uncharacterized protein n=1 Tax=Fusarium oxysporum NRRL 32931 TaxID=660029 RepID=W9HML7_FUSOX|nr:hypothetical protein FOYG_13646 [Fusarium oxysporum NRRL 32931]
MKYSAVAILSLAQGIVAAPSFLEKIKGTFLSSSRRYRCRGRNIRQ